MTTHAEKAGGHPEATVHEKGHSDNLMDWGVDKRKETCTRAKPYYDDDSDKHDDYVSHAVMLKIKNICTFKYTSCNMVMMPVWGLL